RWSTCSGRGCNRSSPAYRRVRSAWPPTKAEEPDVTLFHTLMLLLDSTIRLSVPLLFAALAGLYAERSGVFDIGLEGKMLAGAFAAGTVAAVSGSAWAGLIAAVLVAVLFSLVHGFASITHRGNQIVSGIAINFVVAGATVILGEAWFSQGGRTPLLGADGRFGALALPFADTL